MTVFSRLVHISDLQWLNYIKNVDHQFDIGQNIKVYVKAINIEEKRIYLSYKLASKEFWDLVSNFFKEKKEIVGIVDRVSLKYYDILLNNEIHARYVVFKKRDFYNLKREESGIFIIIGYSEEKKHIKVNFIKKLRSRKN